MAVETGSWYGQCSHRYPCLVNSSQTEPKAGFDRLLFRAIGRSYSMASTSLTCASAESLGFVEDNAFRSTLVHSENGVRPNSSLYWN